VISCAELSDFSSKSEFNPAGECRLLANATLFACDNACGGPGGIISHPYPNETIGRDESELIDIFGLL